MVTSKIRNPESLKKIKGNLLITLEVSARMPVVINASFRVTYKRIKKASKKRK